MPTATPMSPHISSDESKTTLLPIHAPNHTPQSLGAGAKDCESNPLADGGGLHPGRDKTHFDMPNYHTLVTTDLYIGVGPLYGGVCTNR